jgi:hypothetical protein
MAFTAFVFSLASCLADPGVKTGGDRDEHGCIGSAGYTWSPLLKKCIRVFESGIRLNPQASALNPTLSAFIVFKSAEDDAVAELHLPGAKKTIAMPKSGKDDAGTWKSETHTLTQWRGMYTLEDSKGQVLYQAPAAR